MANLRDIKKRIASVKSTKQIARTMEMVSTAKIRRALEAAHAAEPYKDAITLMLVNVVDSGPHINEPLLQVHPELKRALLIVVASDRGLAGGFNIVLERDADKRRRELEEQGVEVEVITCGKKPTEFFRALGVEPALSFVGNSSEPDMEEAEFISSYIIDGYSKGNIDRVELFYNHAKNRMEQVEIISQLLPINPEEMKIPNNPRHAQAARDIKKVPQSSFEFVPSAESVFEYLIPAYLRTVVFHALIDSAAAEHGARRRAMQAATDNASEVITTLSRSYNRIRQGSITTELNEIVGGASALEEM